MLDAFKLTAILISGVLWGAWLVLVLWKKDVHPLRDALEGFSRLGWMKKIGVLFIVVHLAIFGGAKHGGTNDVDDVTSTNDVELVEGGTNDWTKGEEGTNGWEIVEGGTNDLDDVDFGGTNGVEIVEGGETNDVGGMASSPPLMGMRRHLTSGETPHPHFAVPYRLEAVSTNSDISYAIPADGTVRGTWHLTGAYEDVQKVSLVPHPSSPISHPFAFPFGSDLCTSLWAYTWGKVRSQLKNASNEIAAVDASMSAISGVSRFWTAATSNDTYLLTWENFAAGRLPAHHSSDLPSASGLSAGGYPTRDASGTVCAQIELMRNGDFITRSNEVECVYHRVNPDDWDDDGIANEEDAEPIAPADETQFGPHQTVPEGDDANHYCWVDIVVRAANARVTFEGEGDSWLPDPSFIAEANATNRVMILIGKTYAVHCGMPVEIVGKSDEEIETWTSGGVPMIEWPVWFEYVSVRPPLLMASPLFGSGSEDGGTTVRVHPFRMGGGDYSWEDDFCCYSFAADGAPVFDCGGNCGCGGDCYTGEVTYQCSGRAFSFGGWSCGCSGHADDDPHGPSAGPSISADFSAKAIVFEDAYMNAPGQFVSGQSTDSEVTCSAYGGTNGISYSFTIEGADGKLRRIGGARFPMTGTLAAGESFLRRVKYDAVAPSTNVEDIVVHAEYTENGTGATDSKDEKITAVKVKVEATASFPSNKVRHVFGPNEEYQIVTQPGNYGAGRTSTPLDAGGFNIGLSIEGVSYPINLSVVHPSNVVRGEFVRNMTAEDWTSCRSDPLYSNVPGAGFAARWYLQPDYVSFSGIKVCEGTAEMSEVWGCFTNTNDYPRSVYAHTLGLGAGEPISVGYGNLVGSWDYVGVQLGVPPSSAGGFVLVIPWSWGIAEGPYLHFFTSMRQSVSVTVDGETTIRKGSLFTIRGVNQ